MSMASAHVFAVAAFDLSTIPLPVLIGAAIALVLLIVLLAFTLVVIRGARRIHAASARGRLISAERSGTHPLTNFTRDGVPSDPINVKIISTAGQLGTAFAAAGWYRADEIDFVTSLRISIDAVLKRKYATAPVSNLYLFGRRQDYAFERPGASVRERDHVRFWDTGQRFKDGRAIWIGGATRDSAVEISPVTHLPTHRIAPEVDAERGVVANDLIGTGWVVERAWEPGFGKPTETQNAMKDPYFTDGRIAVLELANVPVLPIATQVRGPLIAGATKIVAKGLRWRLPKRGRERAKQQRRRQSATGSAPLTSKDQPD
jgi:hypothetical protein